jgi:hypothetical protein
LLYPKHQQAAKLCKAWLLKRVAWAANQAYRGWVKSIADDAVVEYPVKIHPTATHAAQLHITIKPGLDSPNMSYVQQLACRARMRDELFRSMTCLIRDRRGEFGSAWPSIDIDVEAAGGMSGVSLSPEGEVVASWAPELLPSVIDSLRRSGEPT